MLPWTILNSEFDTDVVFDNEEEWFRAYESGEFAAGYEKMLANAKLTFEQSCKALVYGIENEEVMLSRIRSVFGDFYAGLEGQAPFF